MAELPINKWLSEDYRRTMGTSDAPQNIDTKAPLIPVAAVTVGRGFPTPNSKQRILKYSYSYTNAAADVQVATNTSTLKHYFLGVVHSPSGASTASIAINDATSGTPTITNAATNELYLKTTVSQDTFFPPLPIETIAGIRIGLASGVGTTSQGVVYYMEERLD